MCTEEIRSTTAITSRDHGDGKSAVAELRDLSIGVLHLGKKTRTLRRAGFRTVGDIENVRAGQIFRIPTVSEATAALLIRNRQALLESWSDETGIDWGRYCASIEVPLLPHHCRPASGEEFLACLPDFLSELAHSLPDKNLAVILQERICRPPGRQKTLEEISLSTTPRVTRERVRQKETKLLSQLTGGLLSDDYGGLDIHFRPEFTRWWRRAADRLSHLEEVEFEKLMEALSDAWNVPNDAVMSHLPVILAIITGEPQMTGEIRAVSRLNPRLFGVLRGELSLLPVSRLRLGKYARNLIDGGAATFGDLVSMLQGDGLGPARGKAGIIAAQQANLLATCISDRGTVNWESYREANSLACLPPQPVSGATEFVSGLFGAVGEILSACQPTKRAPDIYRLRTSRPIANRMTLQAVADQLEALVPAVKREETVFLRFLNEVLIGHDYSALPIWLEQSWLKYWDDARDVYKSSSSDYANFTDSLAWKWRLTVREINTAAPTIWAVLTGYPNDRRLKRTAIKQPVLEKLPDEATHLRVGRIRLRGFRRTH